MGTLAPVDTLINKVVAELDLLLALPPPNHVLHHQLDHTLTPVLTPLLMGKVTGTLRVGVTLLIPIDGTTMATTTTTTITPNPVAEVVAIDMGDNGHQTAVGTATNCLNGPLPLRGTWL